jgi:hypothetical protein
MKLEEAIENLENPFDFNEFTTKYAELFPYITIDTFACITGSLSVKKNTVMPEAPKPPTFPTGETPSGGGCCDGKEEPTDEFPTPTTIDMVKSAGIAVGKWLSAGAANVTEEERAKRLDACYSCSSLNGTRCAVCGCFIKLKSWMSTEDCPRKRW